MNCTSLSNTHWRLPGRQADLGGGRVLERQRRVVQTVARGQPRSSRDHGRRPSRDRHAPARPDAELDPMLRLRRQVGQSVGEPLASTSQVRAPGRSPVAVRPGTIRRRARTIRSRAGVVLQLVEDRVLVHVGAVREPGVIGHQSSSRGAAQGIAQERPEAGRHVWRRARATPTKTCGVSSGASRSTVVVTGINGQAQVLVLRRTTALHEPDHMMPAYSLSTPWSTANTQMNSDDRPAHEVQLIARFEWTAGA